MADTGDIKRLTTNASTMQASVVLPELPYLPLPDGFSKRYPEMAVWYDNYNTEMQRWREQANLILTAGL